MESTEISWANVWTYTFCVRASPYTLEFHAGCACGRAVIGRSLGVSLALVPLVQHGKPSRSDYRLNVVHPALVMDISR